MPTETAELCQCGHEQKYHDNQGCATWDDVGQHIVCNCRCFTPPVDEREKAVAELSRKWQLREGGGMGPGLRAYHRIYETGANEGFDAGWNARDKEVERLKRALGHYASPQSWTDEDYATYNQLDITGNCIYLGADGADIARRALEEKS